MSARTARGAPPTSQQACWIAVDRPCNAATLSFLFLHGHAPIRALPVQQAVWLLGFDARGNAAGANVARHGGAP